MVQTTVSDAHRWAPYRQRANTKFTARAESVLRGLVDDLLELSLYFGDHDV